MGYTEGDVQALRAELRNALRELSETHQALREAREGLREALERGDTLEAELEARRVAQPHECQCTNPGCGKTYLVVPESGLCWECSIQETAATAAA